MTAGKRERCKRGLRSVECRSQYEKSQPTIRRFRTSPLHPDRCPASPCSRSRRGRRSEDHADARAYLMAQSARGATAGVPFCFDQVSHRRTRRNHGGLKTTADRESPIRSRQGRTARDYESAPAEDHQDRTSQAFFDSDLGHLKGRDFLPILLEGSVPGMNSYPLFPRLWIPVLVSREYSTKNNRY